ncbi:MAG: right-handed parallel beta-helix repeat-containing protein, partial [Proteobacteria bacterium]|nr:right-handed parallel beta-helix repeat-containing protein [Pseudomonadota bacterium]
MTTLDKHPDFPLACFESARELVRSLFLFILLFTGSGVWIGTAGAVSPGPTSDWPTRTITGDWKVQGKQTIENEKLVINGQVRVLSDANLVLKNAVLEINFSSDSFNPNSGNGNTSLFVESRGTIEFNQSSVITAQPRAMLGARFPGQIAIRNSTFRNVEIAISDATQAVIDDNEFTLQPDHDISNAITFYFSSLNHISGNSIVGEPGLNQSSRLATYGIDLMFSDHNEVHGNTIVGTKGGIQLYASSNNQISGNTWTGPQWRLGDGGVGLESWSNSNVIEDNIFENSGSAILFIYESKNNKISGNTIRDAGLGIVLRWTSGNIISGNTLDGIYEDGLRAYRSYGNFILNNRIDHAGTGIGLFTSWENQLGGNVMQVVDRGLYLFDARDNQIRGNELRDSVQSVFVIQSAGNVLSENNFLQSVLPAIEENSSGAKNNWERNHWESAPSSIDGSGSVAKAYSILDVTTPSFQSIDYGESHSDVTEISGEVVWDGQTKTVTGGISITQGGRLIIRNSILTFSPEGMQQRIWIHVLSGGALEIDD